MTIFKKERLYHRAIEYFGKGKYWELGISLLQELRHINQYEIHSKTEQLVNNFFLFKYPFFLIYIYFFLN